MPAAASWRRNLAGLWIAQFTAFFGFSFVLPFVPLFLSRELHMHSQAEIALWSGLAASASGFSQAIVSPIWGMIADRFGRRQMVLRAMVGSGIVMMIMAAAANAAELVGARFLFGMTTGTIGASTALVAAETPAYQVGWALGVVGSAVAMGRAIGPMVAGFLASFFSLRTVFLLGGALLLVATIPVFLLVRETRRSEARQRLSSLPALLRAQGEGSLPALAAAIAASGLLQFSYMASQQLVVIRMIGLDPGSAALATGVAFAAVGLATGLTAATYSYLLPWTGFHRLAIVAGGLMAVAEAGSAVAPSVALVVVAVAFTGLFFGVFNSAVTSMIGLEAPAEIKATVFGVNGSAMALGNAFGPLSAGSVAAALGIPAGLYLTAAAVASAAGVLLARGREPVAELGPADADVARLPDREAAGEGATQHQQAAGDGTGAGPAGERHGRGAGAE